MEKQRRMKYLRLFEAYFEVNEFMIDLRLISKLLITDVPNSDRELLILEYIVRICIKSNEDGVTGISAIVLKNDIQVGLIELDFDNSDFPDYVFVQYNLCYTNEGKSLYCLVDKVDKSLLDSEKIKRRNRLFKKLSASLPK